MFVSFEDWQGFDVALPSGMTAIPSRYSVNDRGGCETADIEVRRLDDGPLAASALYPLWNWLGYRLIIYNQYMTPCWWGRIDEVVVTNRNNRDGVSIRKLANRLKILYTYNSLGESLAGETDWGENAESVRRYGIRELRQGLNLDGNALLVDSYRDAALSQLSYPLPTFSSVDGRNIYATFHCVGEIEDFKRRYYAQPAGLEENLGNGAAEQYVGQGFTSTGYVGFLKGGKIQDLGGRFKFFAKDHKVGVTGSLSNNSDHLITAVDERDPFTYVANTIGSDPQDDIHDDGEGLDFIEKGDFITLSGWNNQNDGPHVCDGAGTSHITVRPATILGSSPGATKTIVRGNGITVGSSLTNEYPSGLRTITITTHGVRTGTTVRLAGTTSWKVAGISLRVGKVGSPNDSVKVEFKQWLGTTPGAVLDSATVAASSIPKEANTISFQMTNTKEFTAGTDYFIEVSRTGASDPLNFYYLEVDEDVIYSRGQLYLWTGTAWVSRQTNADLIFSVFGSWETSEQIRAIVVAVGQWIRSVDIVTPSGVYSNPYRTGDLTAYDELMKLLGNDSDNRRLICLATLDRVLKVYPKPEKTRCLYSVDADGNFYGASGDPIEYGKLPVGEWVRRADLPEVESSIFRMSPQFLSGAEFDCQSGRIRPRWEGGRDVWASMGLKP